MALEGRICVSPHPIPVPVTIKHKRTSQASPFVLVYAAPPDRSGAHRTHDRLENATPRRHRRCRRAPAQTRDHLPQHILDRAFGRGPLVAGRIYRSKAGAEWFATLAPGHGKWGSAALAGSVGVWGATGDLRPIWRRPNLESAPSLSC